MIEAFAAAFSGTASAIAVIFLVVLVSVFMARRGLITQTQIGGLSAATVNLFLPCLIFAKVVEHFKPSSQPGWWALPLAGIVMALVGTGLGTLVFAGQLPAKRDMLPLAGMQNAGYLVLPVGLALYPDRFDTFAVYVFLFILGFNPILWSLGKVLVTGNSGQKPRWRDLLTPPLVANLVAIGAAFSGASRILPAPVLDAVELVGTAAVPVATVVLGAVLGGISVRFRSHLQDAARTIAVKFFALPLIVVLVLQAVRLHAANPLLAEFFVIEAASAPAVGLVLQVRTYGGNEQRVGTVMFMSYMACTLALPAWVAIWRLIVQ
jgi:predicted permease